MLGQKNAWSLSLRLLDHWKTPVWEEMEDMVLGAAMWRTEIWVDFREVNAFGPDFHWIPFLRSCRPFGLSWKYFPFRRASPQALNHQPPRR